MESVYVSSTALPGAGDGTEQNPVTLAEALGSVSVRATENIYISNGQYTVDEPLTTNLLDGVRIEFESVDGVEIDVTGDNDPKIVANGDNITWVNAHILSNDPLRVSAEEGSYPTDIRRGLFDIRGNNNKFHSCVFHDLLNVAWFSDANGGEWRGCLTFNHGWVGPDRNHGPGLYTQNKHVANVKALYASGSINNYWTGVQAYGSSNAEISNYLFQDFVTTGTRHLIGGAGGGSQNITCTRVHTPNATLQLGYNDSLNQDATITDCINNVLDINNWEIVTQSGNQLVSELTTNIVSVVNNQGYGEHLALVIVWNPESEASVDADLVALNLAAGTLQFRSLQDYFGDRRNVSYDPNVSTVVSLAMSGTVSTPIGEAAPLYDNLFPLFGAWFVVRVQ